MHEKHSLVKSFPLIKLLLHQMEYLDLHFEASIPLVMCLYLFSSSLVIYGMLLEAYSKISGLVSMPHMNYWLV